MPSRKFETLREAIFWAYACLNMVEVARAKNLRAYDRTCYMVRAKAFKAYNEGRWIIHSMLEDNDIKVNLGNDKCWYCGQHTDTCGKLNIEHIFPKSLGGDDSFDNIAYACRKCNSSKGISDLITWYTNSFGTMPSLSLIRIYLKLVLKYATEHQLLNLNLDNLSSMQLPFNPQSLPTIISYLSAAPIL